jgi:hypothetical protein
MEEKWTLEIEVYYTGKVVPLQAQSGLEGG